MERSSEPAPDPGTLDPAELAWRDDLTGAWNRRYLRRLLDEEWDRLAVAEGTITLLVLDLDFFKAVNDNYGHLAGDEVLRWAAGQLSSSFRAEDRLIRHGGDEFVVALFGVGAEEARALAERARSALQTVEVHDLESGKAVTLPLSFSMGLASYPADGRTGEEIFAVADRRLYDEKRARRAAAAPAPPAARWGRRRLLVAASLALLVLASAIWSEWRFLRRTPAPPPAADDALTAGAENGPAAEIVVRDEAELVRLRDEVSRLQAALAEPRAPDDRGRYEARIRELEARLSEAGDEGPSASGGSVVGGTTATAGESGLAAQLNAGGAGGVGAVGARGDVDPTTGMRVGERRTREELSLTPEGLPPASGSPDGVSPGAALPAAGEGTGAPGASAEAPPFEPPQLLHALRPDYPRMAREHRRMATVELKVRVDATGRVLAVEPVGPSAGFGFDESAREAALSAQFRPGRRAGVAVEMETRLAIRFVLEGPR